MDQNPPPSSHNQQPQRQQQQPVYDTSHGGHYGMSSSLPPVADPLQPTFIFFKAEMAENSPTSDSLQSSEDHFSSRGFLSSAIDSRFSYPDPESLSTARQQSISLRSSFAPAMNSEFSSNIDPSLMSDDSSSWRHSSPSSASPAVNVESPVKEEILPSQGNAEESLVQGFKHTLQLLHEGKIPPYGWRSLRHSILYFLENTANFARK